MHPRSIDIFCHVVDNFGDIGFVYRFAREFKAGYPHVSVRVFVDDLPVFAHINPRINPACEVQLLDGIEYRSTGAAASRNDPSLEMADVLIEAFACRIPEPFMKAAESRPRIIINLEHLSAEPWVEGYHRKESLLPVKNLRKYFFMPGFTKDTGGILLDPRIERIRHKLALHRLPCLNGLLRKSGVRLGDGAVPLIGTVFTYERAFDTFFDELADLSRETLLLVFGHKSQSGMTATFDRLHAARIGDRHYLLGKTATLFLPFIPQQCYDALLCLADFNFVRGEDSLVRAILAEKPFIWNAYLQEDTYQKVKVEAFLNRFREFFADKALFTCYNDLLLEFNNAAADHTVQKTGERYRDFFLNLPKIEHATSEMSYFTSRHCNLLRNFMEFLDTL
jgi:uncharacterized repeat protein (TIGR03837 family)